MKRPSLMARLWARAGSRLCLIGIACYGLAGAWAEASYRISRAADTVPAYNRVAEQWRYQPPALVRRLQRTPDAAAPLPPAWAYPLGSDNLGRDVLQRLLQGTRIALLVGVLTSLIALPLGVLLGCLGGYFGRRIDDAVVWLCATVASVPTLLLILAIAMVAGKGMTGLCLGIGLTTWVGVCRSVRAEVIKHRNRTYVLAATVMGYSHARVLFRHILPNVLHIVLISFSIRFPASVATEVFVSFLGIGVQGEPSWGVMLNNARLRLWQGVWWEMTFVTLAIFGLVLCFNVLSDRLRDLLDPSIKGRL